MVVMTDASTTGRGGGENCERPLICSPSQVSHTCVGTAVDFSGSASFPSHVQWPSCAGQGRQHRDCGIFKSPGRCAFSISASPGKMLTALGDRTPSIPQSGFTFQAMSTGVQTCYQRAILRQADTLSGRYGCIFTGFK